jgi:metal-sulfur cluster biosynthetic enzyme
MAENMTEAAHVEGPPWNIHRRFSTFSAADECRLELLLEEDVQAKVQWSRLRDDFVVKSRVNPAIALKDAAAKKRAEKKKRKAKLNKKRRKK